MTKNSTSKEMLERAYAVQSSDDVQRLYQDWAGTYDQHLEVGLGYQAPELLSSILSHVVDDFESKVLDVGCGTGLVGLNLSTRGFINVDGLDFSSGMLEVARKKRVYKKLIQADLNKKLEFDDETYDAIICCGTFTRGHVGPKALIELLRILKHGAPLACTINSGVWAEKKFDQWLEVSVRDGLVILEEKLRENYFSKSDEKGFFCLLRRG